MTKDTASNKQARDLSIDILRIAACFGVIIRHVVDIRLLSTHWLIGTLYDILSYTSIPVFFMITGYLLLDKEESYSSFFRKRFLKILLPFLFWALVYHQFGNRFCNMQLGRNFIRVILRGNFFYHLWFVYYVTGIYLAVPLIRKASSRLTRTDLLYLIGLWLLFSTVMPYVSKHFHYDLGVNYIFSGYWGFVFVGYLIKKTEITKRLFTLAFTAVVAIYLIVAVGTVIYTSGKQGVFLNHLDLLSITMILMSAGLFIVFKYGLSGVKDKVSQRTAKIIVTVSNLTFAIYLIHALIIDIFYRGLLGFTLLPSFINPILGAPVLSLMVFLISLTVVFIFSRIPVLKWFV